MIKRRTTPRPKALWFRSQNKIQTKTPKRAPVRKGRVRQVSVGRAVKLKAYNAKRKAFLHRRPCCQKCGGKASDIHHKRGRAGTLLVDERHWASVCRECHNWIGENPLESRALELLCDAGLWNVPDSSPA